MIIVRPVQLSSVYEWIEWMNWVNDCLSEHPKDHHNLTLLFFGVELEFVKAQPNMELGRWNCIFFLWKWANVKFFVLWEANVNSLGTIVAAGINKKILQVHILQSWSRLIMDSISIFWHTMLIKIKSGWN